MQSVTKASRSKEATQRELDNKEIACQAAIERAAGAVIQLCLRSERNV